SNTTHGRINHLVKGLHSFQRIPDLQDKRMRNRSRRWNPDPFSTHHNGNAVTPTDIRTSVDHRSNRRMHAASPKMHEWSITKQAPTPCGFRCDTRRLTEKTEQGGFIDPEVEIAAFET